MDPILDFLTQNDPDGSLVATLAGVIDEVPHQPNLTAQLGLYTAEGIFGTTAKFDRHQSTLTLVQTSERGTDAPTANGTSRNMVHFETSRVALERKFMADEVLNMRKLGDTSPETLQNYMAQELAPVTGSVRATLENHRVGGLRGFVMDADDTIITDIWTKMGIAEPATIYFDIDNNTNIRQTCANIVRAIADALGGLPFDHVHALVGSEFFDKLVNAPEVRETYLNQQEASELREGTAYTGQSFKYGGIVFQEYRGRIGGTDFVEADEARFFPVGAGIFRQFFAPADRDGFPGAGLGMVEYALPHVDPKGRFREVEIQSNPATVCTRPDTLRGARIGADPAP